MADLAVDVAGIALTVAGGLTHIAALAGDMIGHGNNLARDDLLGAEGAIDIAGIALVVAGGLLNSHELAEDVALRADDLALEHDLAALVANGVAGVAVGGTGGVLGVDQFRLLMLAAAAGQGQQQADQHKPHQNLLHVRSS